MPGQDFQDDFEDSLREAANLSDADLEALMGGSAAPAPAVRSFEELEPGTFVDGVVVEIRAGDVLVEIDGKTLGIIEVAEYGTDPLPEEGSRIRAEFVRYDAARELCVLTTKAVRTEIAWDELREGMTIEGSVVETNKGGLTLDVKGMRAFMPISQIALERVEDAERFVGRKFRCEVTRVDRDDQNLVVSRRVLLEREREAERARALETLGVGQTVRGRVTRTNEHGAFVDVGGVDGLLHTSKIHKHVQAGGDGGLAVGDLVEVEITNIDRERGRIGLDFVAIEENAWETVIANYAVGDEVAGWISRVDDGGAVLALDEGLETVIPERFAKEEFETGAIVRATILSIDEATRRVEVRPL